MLTTDGLALPFRDDGAVVDATGKIVEHLSHLAKLPLQVCQRGTTQVGAHEDAHAVHVVGRLLPYPPYPLYAQLVDEILRTVRMNDAQSVGLTVVAGYLCQELAVAHAGRSRQTRIGLDACLDLLRAVHRQGDAPLIDRHVEESLIERQRLYQVGIVAEYTAYLHRHLLISMEAGLHDDELRTQPLRRLDRLRRMNAELTGLVAGRRHHTTHGIIAHSHGLAPQLRPVSLLHRREELVHIHVYDASQLLHFHLQSDRKGTSILVIIQADRVNERVKKT